jgi:S1-C subfamily serine protease
MYEPRQTSARGAEPQFSGLFSRWALLLLAVVLAATLLRSACRAGAGVDPNAAPRTVEARGDLAEDERATIALFNASVPSVVHVTTSSLVGRTFDVAELAEGSGSGFLWDEDGHVVTNLHVVSAGNSCRVELWDRSQWSATLVGYAPEYDLAVLAIDAPRDRLRPIPIGTSTELQVGQKAFAIGFPFGLESTLTTGVVSGLERQIMSLSREPIRGVIQTDAAINPGNSGGPLLDSAGRLIGINTAIYSPSGAYAGVGFAVPVDTVNRVVPNLIRNGELVRPGLGIFLGSSEFSEQAGIDGAIVLKVLAGSAAERAGLRGVEMEGERPILGDVNTAIDERAVSGREDVLDVLAGYRVGDEVRVHVLRGPDLSRGDDVSVRLQTLR